MFVYIFETYLDWRQYLKLLETKKPAKVGTAPARSSSLVTRFPLRVPWQLTYVEDETFTKAQLYGQDKARFGFVSSLFGTAQSVAVIVYGVLPLLWDFSGDLMQRYAWRALAACAAYHKGA